MEKELIGPTATLAAAILSKVEQQHGELTKDVIASAFVDAYSALLEGINRVSEEVAQPKPRRKGVLDF